MQTYEYSYLKHLQPLNQWTSYFAFAMFAFQIVFVYNIFYSLVKGPKAPNNPWEVGTLEWETTSLPSATLRAFPPCFVDRTVCGPCSLALGVETGCHRPSLIQQRARHRTHTLRGTA